MTKVNLDFFSWRDFLCKCGIEHDVAEIPESYQAFVLYVDQELRPACDFPFIVTSGWRCREHPIEKRKRHLGPHTIAAMDVKCSHKNADKLLAQCYAGKVITGKGVSQKGAVRFIHIDTLPAESYRPRPHIWSY